MSTSFTTIPTLSLSHALSPNTKPAFLSSLRSALLHVGFLYLADLGIPDDLIEDVVSEAKKFFELSVEEKLKVEMKRERSFWGIVG